MKKALVIHINGVWCTVMAVESPIEQIMQPEPKPPRPLNDEELEQVTAGLDILVGRQIKSHYLASRN